MLKRIRRLLDGSRRRTKKAGKELSVFLSLLAGMGPPRQAGFILLTLRQRQPYLAFLLRYAGLEHEAAAVERLDWMEGEQVKNRTSGLAARRRFEKANKVLSQAIDAAAGIMGDKEMNKTKAEKLAAMSAYVEVSLSIKHAWRTQAKFWKVIEAGGLENLTEEEKAAPNPVFEALRDAVVHVSTLIRLAGSVEQGGDDLRRLREGGNEANINKKIQAAMAEQIAWILNPPISEDSDQTR